MPPTAALYRPPACSLNGFYQDLYYPYKDGCPVRQDYCAAGKHPQIPAPGKPGELQPKPARAAWLPLRCAGPPALPCAEARRLPATAGAP